MNFSKDFFRLRKQMIFFLNERNRIEKLKFYEKKQIVEGFRFVAGIDEVGRGALAGPAVAAAVIIKDIDSFFIAYLKDSKKLNRKKRQYLYDIIINKFCDIGIGIVEPQVIEKINIANACFLAMKRAILNLKRCPDYILVDAFKIPDIDIPQNNLIKGEDKSISIAAASVIAKEYRDRIMCQYHQKYPYYHFSQNVGYGTKQHMMAIKKYGICPLHRKTFKGVSNNFNRNVKKTRDNEYFENKTKEDD